MDVIVMMKILVINFMQLHVCASYLCSYQLCVHMYMYTCSCIYASTFVMYSIHCTCSLTFVHVHNISC